MVAPTGFEPALVGAHLQAANGRLSASSTSKIGVASGALAAGSGWAYILSVSEALSSSMG
jgi:hypothetical protein